MSVDLHRFLASLKPLAAVEILWSRSGQRFSVATYLSARLPPAEFITSVRAVVNHDGMLVALRNPDGVHVMPGGRLERGETYEQALEREVFEETGLRVHEPKQIGFLHFRHLTPKPDAFEYPYPDMIHLVYTAKGLGTPFAGDPDGWEQELALVSIADARELKGNEYARPFLDYIASGA